MQPELSPESLRVFQDLIAQDRKIEAIKYYRDQTGADLAAAKNAIEKLAPSDTPATPPSHAPKPDDSLIIHTLQKDGKIAAIKLYRERTGSQLRDAKLAVEEIARANGVTPRRQGCLGVLAIMVLTAAGLLLWLFA